MRPWLTQRLQQKERMLWLAVLAAIVFFGRWRLMGLMPDAALYAGLSLKVFKTREFWLLAGTQNKFGIYFEHPPFFFQWGAWILSFFGVNEGAARAIGAIPGYVGLMVFVYWISRKWGDAVAVLTGLFALVWGHYTKYATTCLLEAPLSLAVILVAISSYELHWRESLGRRRIFWWVVLYFSLALATAVKGVAGLGAFGGLVLSIFFALLFSERPPFKVLMGALSIGICLLAALSPFAVWFYKLSQVQEIERFVRYFLDQVLRSLSTNRGEIAHPLSGDRFYYLNILFKQAFWGSALFLAGSLYFFRRVLWVKNAVTLSQDRALKAWFFHALAFILAFTVPFSFVSYQLPHYIHPVYLLMLLPGAAMVAELLKDQALAGRLFTLKSRWGFLGVFAVAFPLYFHGATHVENRGQDFMEVATHLQTVAPTCKILIQAQSFDAYSAEAFSLWYFRGRPWSFVEHDYPARIAVPDGAIFWSPGQAKLWGGSGCSL